MRVATCFGFSQSILREHPEVLKPPAYVEYQFCLSLCVVIGFPAGGELECVCVCVCVCLLLSGV